MGNDTTSRHLLFADACSRAGWNARQAWLSYLALGGLCDIFDVEAFLEGLVTLDANEQDVLAVALNERLHDLYVGQLVPYLHTLGAAPSSPSVAEALTDLLAQAERDRADG
jgi:hypothetical protein